MLIDIIIKQINSSFYWFFCISCDSMLIRDGVWICIFWTDNKLYVTSSLQFTVYTLKKHMFIAMHSGYDNKAERGKWDKILSIPKDVNLWKQWAYYCRWKELVYSYFWSDHRLCSVHSYISALDPRKYMLDRWSNKS